MTSVEREVTPAVGGPLFLVLGPALLPHLTLALAEHARWCRRHGSVMPPELAALLEVLADNGSRSRPTRDDPAAPVDHVAVTYARAAQRLDCSVRSVRRLVAAGHLRAIGSGRGRRIPVAELEQFANAKGTAA